MMSTTTSPRDHSLAVAAMVTALLAVTAAATPAAAAEWHVAPGGSDLDPGTPEAPFATIQHAIAAADTGDIVLLADGVHEGEGNRQISFLGKAIKVRSAGGVREKCVVRLDGHDGFLFQSGESQASLLADLTIRGGSRGVDVSSGIPSLANCVIDSCTIGLDVSGMGTRVSVAGFLITRCGTGVLFRDDAGGGTLADTQVRDGAGHGVRTTGGWTVYGMNGLQMTGCQLIGNQGSGLQHEAFFGGVRFSDGEVAGNGGWGLYSGAIQDCGLAVSGGSVHGNALGGIDNRASHWDSVRDCRIYGNQGPGIVTSWDVDNIIENCDIFDNAGHGVAFWNGPLPAEKRLGSETVANCRIRGNGGSGIELAYGSYGDHLVTDCVIDGNAGPGLRVTAPVSPNANQRLLVQRTTLTGNAHGLQLGSDFPVFVENTLIAFNDGAAVDCLVAPQVTLTCSDLYGNAGGDWTGPVAPQAGANGNFAADPLFMDAAAGDYRLLDLSPCAAANQAACGRVGALDVGAWAAPRFLALTDVGNDQGGSLRLSWLASHFDRPDAAQPVTGYAVYRRQDSAKRGAAGDDKLLGWDFLAVVPSRGDTAYQYVAPTLVNAPAPGDSTGAWSVFMVSAMTASPFTFHDSAPDSGVSLDNLAPARPNALRLETGRRLAWDECRDDDFAHYVVYGAPTGVRDGRETRLLATGATSLNVADVVHPCFLVAAVDRHGNESPLAVWAAAAATGDATAASPLLHPGFPNPFNPSTTLAFELPAAGRARIAVFDLSGRLVRALVDASLEAGPHRAMWDGRDDAGRIVGAGAYLARLEAAGTARTTRLTLVK